MGRDAPTAQGAQSTPLLWGRPQGHMQALAKAAVIETHSASWPTSLPARWPRMWCLEDDVISCHFVATGNVQNLRSFLITTNKGT